MSVDESRLMTRRRSLALLGSGGAGLLVAGTSGSFGSAFARTIESDGYVANAANACSLTAEQEEGPFYVALERVREDITGGQAGVPLALEITIINSLSCKPLKHAAVDIWHCNASGVYSDIGSEDTLGKTYLRGVQWTDKHGRVSFKTLFPGHYAGRTTHVHAKVHVSSHSSGGKLAGGHVAHTGQMFPSQAIYGEVYKLSPYNAETARIVTHAQDRVWSQQHGAEALMTTTKAGHRLTKGLIASVTLAVNPHATPAAVGSTGVPSPPP